MTISAASSPCAAVSDTMSATGSPTKRTRSVASHGRAISAEIHGRRGRAGARSTSAAVSTATTPGMPMASDTSIDSTTACAIGERTNVTTSAPSSPSSVRLAMYRARPWMRAGSSRRTTFVPIMLMGAVLALLAGGGACHRVLQAVERPHGGQVDLRRLRWRHRVGLLAGQPEPVLLSGLLLDGGGVRQPIDLPAERGVAALELAELGLSAV